ncbi:MAG: DUF4266 domain-containing protein [Paraglaciecola sp.]|nr:DUF4266 domain-containing protein [Paraglaciecola sp.]NCT47735.1 DUF4266 domain-containing protein [Paraglaciecola sp.]
MQLRTFPCKSVGRMLLFAALALLNIACASIEPWVQPYERDNLADPIMATNRNPVATSYTHHAYQAREGARGAEGGAGGGCGCN